MQGTRSGNNEVRAIQALSVSSNAFDRFALAQDTKLSAGLGGRPVITSLKVSRNDDLLQRIEVSDIGLNKVFGIEFEPRRELKIVDTLHCTHSGLFGEEQLLFVVTENSDGFNRNLASTSTLHVHRLRPLSQGYERLRIVQLGNLEGLTASKLFVSNGSLYIVMNEGSICRSVNRLLVEDLISDEVQQLSVDLGSLQSWRYSVNDRSLNEMDEVSSVVEI